MRTIGGFTMPVDETHAMVGKAIANMLLESIKDGTLSINDKKVKHFLPVIFAEGNFEFLRAIAENIYNDTRKEIIVDFIDLVKKMTQEGAKELNNKVEAKLNGTDS